MPPLDHPSVLTSLPPTPQTQPPKSQTLKPSSPNPNYPSHPSLLIHHHRKSLPTTLPVPFSTPPLPAPRSTAPCSPGQVLADMLDHNLSFQLVEHVVEALLHAVALRDYAFIFDRTMRPEVMQVRGAGGRWCKRAGRGGR